MGSTRLPGKVLADVAGTPMLVFMLERLGVLKEHRLVVATSDLPRDDAVADAGNRVGVPVVRGSELDVLQRFGLALAAHPTDIVVRLTGDCPLSDPRLVNTAIEQIESQGADYVSNTLVRTFPNGLDVEAVRADALRAALAEAHDPVEREHVTPFVYRHPERFRLLTLRNDEPLGDERWTVDDAKDLDFVRSVVRQFNGRRDFSWHDVLQQVGRRARPAVGDLHLRPAFADDRDFILRLRNDRDAVAFSQSGRAVPFEEHRRWFEQSLQVPATRIWIGELDGTAVGQIRVDVRDATGTVSIAVDPAQRGHGRSVEMLRLLQRTLLEDEQITTLVAQVHPENSPSLRAFERVGFNFTDPEPESGFQRLRWVRSRAS